MDRLQSSSRRAARASRAQAIFFTTLGAGLFAAPAIAQDVAVGGCMEEAAGFHLQCTANDVRIAEAQDIVILDDGCAYPGDTVTFQATFVTELSAQARHDLGLYFATDGDPNFDGAVSGECAVATVPFAPDGPWLDLDGTLDGGFCANNPALSCESDRDCKSVGGTCAFTQDLCGDIDDAHNPLHPVVTITAACADFDGNGKLNLPTCTSWRQPGANELCLGPEDAFPGAPSKCNCDYGFELDIDVPPATITVTKTPSVTSVDEPGEMVTFDVTIRNDSPFAKVVIDSIDDDIFGDLTTFPGSTCEAPQAIAPGATYACSFTGYVTGLGGETHVNVVTAVGTDENDNVLEDDDDAVVAIVDLLPSVGLVKTASVSEVLEPGADVTFTIDIVNTSPADAVWLTSLTDTVYGDLAGKGSCTLPQLVPVGGSYSCAFTEFVGGAPGDDHMNVATVLAEDDEGNTATASDSAMVNVNDVPSSIAVDKVASPVSVPEPGGLVTYTYSVTNTSLTDSVLVDVMIDDILGDLDGQGTCSVPQLLAPGAGYGCTLSVWVEGNAGDVVTNVVDVYGTDDDGVDLHDADDATVNVRDVPPSATLSKTVTSMVVHYEVTVRNTSAAEALELEHLADDAFGDVTSVGGDVVATTCSVPQVLAPAGSAGDTYTCAFDGLVTSSPHVNVVTGTVSDDEGGVVQPSDDAEVTF